MDKDQLHTILTDARVPEGLRDLVLANGFDCPSDFAFALPTIAELQPFLASATTFWTANGIEERKSSVAAERLMKALAECHRICVNAPQGPDPSSSSGALPQPQNALTSWTGHLPPKLTVDRVNDLIVTFCYNLD